MALPKLLIKAIPKPFAAIAFLVLMLLAIMLFLGRRTELFRSEALLAVAPAFYTHVSNFSISYLLAAGIGYGWLMLGVRIAALLWLALAVALANIVYESFIPILNTPDPMDAWFGLAGTALAALVLWAIARHGLVANPGLAVPGARSDDP